MARYSYDIAQICLNGHEINSSFTECPEYNKKYCEECGEKTIIRCLECNSEIQGDLRNSEITIPGYDVPAFCYNCGKPYPWTKTKIDSAKELALELEGLSEEDKELLSKSIDDLVKDTPKTNLAVSRFKRIVGKAGNVAWSEFKSLLTGVISETAKKLLYEK